MLGNILYTFDLTDLEAPAKANWQEMHLCTSCRLVSLTDSCSCGSTSFVPFLDRRPLLLSEEVIAAIVELVDNTVQDLDDSPEGILSEESIDIASDYLPFLTSFLQGSEEAEKRKDNGAANYRETSMNTSEVIAAIKDRKMPTTGTPNE